MKDGNLYRAKQDIPTSETWTAAHWEQVKLANDVGDLKTAFDSNDIKETLLAANIPGTTQTVTFDSGGKPQSIVHTANNTAVRTDAFTWTSGGVTETRTLADGTYITLATNLTTLVTTISEIQEAA